MNKVNVNELDCEEVLALFYSCLVDDVVEMGVSRREVRDKIDQKLADVAFQVNIKRHNESPETVAKPEPKPFTVTPEMQQFIFSNAPTQMKRGDVP